MTAFILTLALLTSPSPTPSAGAILVTVQGIVVGGTATAMIAKQGEPVGIAPNQGGDDYIYLAATDNALIFARVVRGNVVGIAVKPAPWKPLLPAAMPSALGVSLGDSMQAVKKIPDSSLVDAAKQDDGGMAVTYKGEDGLNYTFVGDPSLKVAWIRAQLPDVTANALPTSIVPTLHGGTSMADAIVDIAPNEEVGVKAEYVYFALHRCGNGGLWRTQSQALLHDGSRSYDLMSEVCSNGGTKRDFYFDITGYFGKMGP